MTQANVNRLAIETAELREALAQRDAYIAHMGQQLRNPLMAVLGYGSLLQPHDAEQKSHLSGLLHAAESILAMVSDLPSGMVGSTTPHLRPASMASLAGELHGCFGFDATRKGLNLKLHVDEAIPESLLCDLPALRECLMALLHNAIRFTERGEAVLNITQQEADSHSALLCFAVQDTGVGIAASRMDSLLTAPPTNTRHFGRAGNSLPRIAALVQRMGGNLHHESTHGQGSRFWFLLRLPVYHSQVSPSERMSPLHKPFSAAQVLVVDDQAMNRELLSVLLRQLGISHIDTAADGEEAVAKAQAQPPHLVLMDCQMPRMDGFAAATALKHHPRTAHIPIIGITADVMRADTARCFAAGMDDYRQKPLTLPVLDALLHRWLPKTEQDAEAS